MAAFPDSKHKSEVLGRPQCITLNRLVTPTQVHFFLSVSLSQSKEMSRETLAIIYQFIHRGCLSPPLHMSHTAGKLNGSCIPMHFALEPHKHILQAAGKLAGKTYCMRRDIESNTKTVGLSHLQFSRECSNQNQVVKIC